MADVFKCTQEAPPAKNGDAYTEFSTPMGDYKAPEYFPPNSTVHVSMTPRQERELRMSNYPHYDALCVENRERPRVGHKV